jgi:hypothetical protein
MAADWEIAKIVGTEEEASVVVGFLQSSGIPAEVESLLAQEFPVNFGDLGEVRIRVPADRLQEAQALLDDREDLATGEEGEMAGSSLDEEPGER